MLIYKLHDFGTVYELLNASDKPGEMRRSSVWVQFLFIGHIGTLHLVSRIPCLGKSESTNVSGSCRMCADWKFFLRSMQLLPKVLDASIWCLACQAIAQTQTGASVNQIPIKGKTATRTQQTSALRQNGATLSLKAAHETKLHDSMYQALGKRSPDAT